MIFKMIGIERMWKNRARDIGEVADRRPRQIFITQSIVLAEKVKEYFIKMSQALEVEWQDNQTRHVRSPDLDMFDLDEEELHNSTLPGRFSDLTDDHFPLFVTSDQVCEQYIAVED